MRLRFIATALMALLCAGVWAQQQPSRPGMGQRNLLQQRQELRQQATPRAGEETVVISFDVKLWDERIPKSSLVVYTSHDVVRYDEASGLFTVECPKSDEPQNYGVECWDYSMAMFSKSGTFSASQSATIEVDMTDYHAVSLTVDDPELWELESVVVTLKDAEAEYPERFGFSSPSPENAAFYAGPGEYTVVASFLSTGDDRTFYAAGAVQTFTLEDDGKVDVVVTYDTDVENCHQVTFAMTDRDGNAMPGLWISVYSSAGTAYYGSLDDEGETTLMLHDGEYRFTIAQDPNNSTVYYQGEFTVAGQDMTVKATMDGVWKKLAVKLTGDLLADFINPEWSTYYNTFRLTGPHIGSSIDIDMEAGENNTIVNQDAVFLRSDLYEYQLSLDREGRQLNATGTLQLTEDTELALDFSSEKYGQALIEITDAEGNRLEDTSYDYINLYDGYSQRLVNYRYNSDVENIYYLPAGNYTIALPQDYTDEVYSERFTVTAGETTRVAIRMEEHETAKVDVQVKVPSDVLDMIYDFQFALWTDKAIGLGYYSDVTDLDPQTGVGTVSLVVPKGTYTYELWPENLNRTATIDIDKDTQLSFDFTAEPYMHITLTDEAGVPLSTDKNDGEFYLLQDGKEPIHSDSEYGLELIAFLTPGTYNVWGTVYFYENDSYMNVNVQQTVTMGNTTQHVNITVPTPEPKNRFAVEFNVYDKVTTNTVPTSTITLNGVTAPLIYGWTTFVNLPAGSYPYTIQAEGYETYTGTVEVNENTADEDGEVDLYVYLTRKPFTTDLAATPNDAFSLFPTVADDVLHIAPATAVGGEWTVRITSPHGMTMYNGRHVLDAETVLPVGNLAPGLYLLTLDNGTETVTYKFVKR